MVVEVQVLLPMYAIEDVGWKLSLLLFVFVRLLRSSSKRDWFVRRKTCAR